MMQTKINFIALAAAISSLLLVAISVFVPWWVLSISSPVNAQVNFSPVNFNLSHSGAAIAIPLISALTVACLLTLLAGGIMLAIYSVKPTESYSRRLLGFGYKKPLYTLAAFVVILFATSILLHAFMGITLPINGSEQIAPRGASASASVSGVLNWPFYFAIAVTGLCIVGRAVHGKVAQPPTISQ